MLLIIILIIKSSRGNLGRTLVLVPRACLVNPIWIPTVDYEFGTIPSNKQHIFQHSGIYPPRPLPSFLKQNKIKQFNAREGLVIEGRPSVVCPQELHELS